MTIFSRKLTLRNTMKSPKLQIPAIIIVLVLIALAPKCLLAQDYHWKNTFPNESYCVAFNPLSEGKILFTATTLAPGIFRSDDGGQTWQNYLGGLPISSQPDIHQFLCLPSDTAVVLAVTTSVLYRSTDGGHTWADLSPLGGVDGEDIAYYAPKDQLYYAQNGIGTNPPIWRSEDRGAHWTQTGQGTSTVTLCTIAVSPDSTRMLLSGSLNGVIDRSSDEGAHWDSAYAAENAGTPQAPEIPKIVFDQHAPSVAVAARWRSTVASIARSTDHGVSWTRLNTPERHAWALEIDQRATATKNGLPQHLWTGLFFQGEPDTVSEGDVLESNDGGATWHTTGFPSIAPTSDVWMLKHDTTSGTLVAATDSGIYVGHEPASGVSLPEKTNAVVAVFPNPTFGVCFINLPAHSGLTRFELFDETGRMVMGETVKNESQLPINLTNLPSGIYCARVTSTDGLLATQKIARIPK